ncbi:Ribosomal protein S36 [Trypanosoma melophagium]|uniref:Ribosomal protein S36 n=1 Tax=Trypanosoma melophagium TaxID=715481 RepID=UPI00351A9FF0|nr:Ribosomal protein S36 [Trypanosoma melophagium]
MLSLTMLRYRQPLIRFTYAMKKSGGAVVGSSTVAASPVKNILETFDELPTKFRPHVFTEEEMELILTGGATPYVPKSLQRKKTK